MLVWNLVYKGILLYFAPNLEHIYETNLIRAKSGCHPVFSCTYCFCFRPQRYQTNGDVVYERWSCYFYSFRSS